MKAIDRPFTKIVNGTTQFVIPVFQRDYTWTEGNCEQLFNDVLSIASNQTDRGHFIGSIVYISTGDTSAGFTRWLLIDGQQRVTTLMLLFAALRDHIQQTKWKGSDDGPTPARVDAYFLKNMQETGPRHHKLVLRKHDQETLAAILDQEERPTATSERIRDNYEYFRDRLQDVDPETVYRGIGRLIVVDVTLDRGIDDPQLIFESLNSTGVDLSQADLIRNFILMRLPEPEQTRLYEKYWSRIEAMFRGSERTFDAFVRDYVALETQASKQQRSDNIYNAFRPVFRSLVPDDGQLDSFLDKLVRFARYHAAFAIGEGAIPQLKEPLARLRRQVDVPATVVMRLFDCHDHHHTLSVDHFVKALGLLESYVFRRAICGEQTRGYWQTFANIAYAIETARPFESMTIGLARQRDSYRFPVDSEFRQALEERDLYGKRVCFDLLDRLENHENREPSDTSGYSIEHIMPQNERLNRDWKEMLGDDWRETQREWLHRLGNLTLTGYNSTYSDRSFEDKKTIKGGFAESSVRLNRFVRESKAWTPKEMQTRGKELAARALIIWPTLEVDKRLLDEVVEGDLRAKALRRDPDKVKMTPKARELFASLQARIREMDEDVIELAEQSSVSYHGPSFFLEVVPRKHRLNLLLALDYNEVEDPMGIARDASEKAFFVNAVYECGVYVLARELTDLDEAMRLIRQAHALVSAG
jgi:predicted transport protein